MTSPFSRSYLLCLLYINCTLLSGISFAFETKSIHLNSNIEVDFTYKNSKNKLDDTLLLILPSEYGLQKADIALLNILPDYNISVWTTNLLESYFLPNSASNLEKIPTHDIQDILQKIHTLTNKQIVILTSGRGAIPVLRALASWPDKFAPSYLKGIILMHPKLFTQTPEPGLVAEVMPSVKNTNQLIYLIQPTQSPFWWNRNITINGLQRSGSDVFVQVLNNVRNRYYFRPDATLYEQSVASKYPNLIYTALKQIKNYPSSKRPVAKNFQSTNHITSIKKQRTLSHYKGNPIPPSLKLEVFNNKSNNNLAPPQMYNNKNDNGKVRLINFWASWCPPCVHEMPSMQALDNRLNKIAKGKFKILAVNMAEDKETITNFLKSKVSINFDILLDTKGIALKQWKIFAFPTSFIIDKKNQIRYAIYGGIDWLEPDVVDKIQKLISE